MFPNGVIYEGVSTEPFKLRGESGANDSMIPLGDNLLELTVTLPSNPLTEVLKDFRSYRPRNHRVFLEHIQHRATTLGLRKFAMGDANSAAFYLANIDLIRSFRHHHWLITKEYIVKHTQHPVATGGSPIVTWLPNQLAAVLDLMDTVIDGIRRDDLTMDNRVLVSEITARVSAEQNVLQREVVDLTRRYGDKAAQVDAVEATAMKA
jgi:indoleamine 2,3-dioxygenase